MLVDKEFLIIVLVGIVILVFLFIYFIRFEEDI